MNQPTSSPSVFMCLFYPLLRLFYCLLHVLSLAVMFGAAGIAFAFRQMHGKVDRFHWSRRGLGEDEPARWGMGPTEIAYRLNALSKDHPSNLRVGLFLSLSADPDSAAGFSDAQQLLLKLKQAASALQRRHPMLRCRVSEDNRHFVPDASLQIKCTVHTFAPQSPNQEWNLLDLRKDETLIDAAPMEIIMWLVENHLSLMLTCQHYACDGISISSLTHELLQLVLAGLAPGPALPVVRPVESLSADALRRSGRIVSLTRFAVHGSWLSAISGFQSIWNVLVLFQRKARRYNGMKPMLQIASVQFSAQETELALQACRRRGTTLTGAIIGSMHAAVRQQFSATDKRFVVTFPCDVRKALYPADAPLPATHLGLQISSTLPYMAPASARVWDVAQDFKQYLAACFNAYHLPVLGRFLVSTFMSPWFMPVAERMTSVLFTNWGRLPIEKKYGVYQVQGAVHPFVNKTGSPTLTVIAATGPNGLNLVMVGGGGYHLLAPEFAKALCEKTAACLKQAICE